MLKLYVMEILDSSQSIRLHSFYTFTELSRYIRSQFPVAVMVTDKGRYIDFSWEFEDAVEDGRNIFLMAEDGKHIIAHVFKGDESERPHFLEAVATG